MSLLLIALLLVSVNSSWVARFCESDRFKKDDDHEDHVMVVTWPERLMQLCCPYCVTLRRDKPLVLDHEQRSLPEQQPMVETVSPPGSEADEGFIIV